jgi:hypothetical protein
LTEVVGIGRIALDSMMEMEPPACSQ